MTQIEQSLQKNLKSTFAKKSKQPLVFHQSIVMNNSMNGRSTSCNTTETAKLMATIVIRGECKNTNILRHHCYKIGMKVNYSLVNKTLQASKVPLERKAQGTRLFTKLQTSHTIGLHWTSMSQSCHQRYRSQYTE